MKIFLMVLVACLLASPTYAQKADAEGFVPLFNGKNLKGWKATTDKPESFLVEDGMLVCRGGRAHLFYTGSVGKADFTNFELKLRIKTTNNSNSGVYFHTEYQADGWPKVGFEAQVNSTHSDPKKTGSLYGIANWWAPGSEVLPFGARIEENGEIYLYQAAAPSYDDEWFDYHITVQGNHITIRVNGQITVDWTQPKTWNKTRRIGHGTIGLQAHDPTCNVYYQDIRIKELE